MATSRTTRALDYLGSTPNLAGSGLALVALFVTTITGLGGALWPVLIALVYIIGLAIFVLFNVPIVTAKNMSTILAFRFLTGFAASPALATGVRILLQD